MASMTTTSNADGVVVLWAPARWDDERANPVLTEYAPLWESLAAGVHTAMHEPRMTGTDMDWRLSNGPVVEILVQAHRMKYAPPVISADRLDALDARTADEDANAATARRNEARWERPALPDPRDRGQAA